ncbi:hypothetical protein MS5786_33720 [Klebsiella pneumoniae]|nr:hypothetical protein MS5786_33720 [Klebsiella pneumoniae]
MAYSKNGTDKFPLLKVSIVFLAIRFPGEPIIDISAPIVAPNTKGMSSLMGLI